MQKQGDALFTKGEKVNSELLAITYGTFVMQLLNDYKTVEEVNQKLQQIGMNIGMRIVDEFFARSGQGPCSNFEETAEVLTKIGFKMFLGVAAEIKNWNEAKTEFSIVMPENPFAEFVELPQKYKHNLHYSNIICGIIKGALKIMNIIVRCEFLKDTLTDDEYNEIKVILEEIIQDKYEDDDDS